MYRHLSEDVMVNIRNIIRRSEDRNVQFSPIILFTEECDFDTYVRYVKIGFDDVLTLPDKRDMLVARLENQITSEHIYFETADYLGPDRRRLELPGQTDPRRGGESRSYSRHLVQRSVTEGSRPIRSDLLSNTPLAMRAGGGMY
jgi:DNA-binding response OmpR family regulator